MIVAILCFLRHNHICVCMRIKLHNNYVTLPFMELNFGVAAHNLEIQNGRHESKIYCTVHSEI